MTALVHEVEKREFIRTRCFYCAPLRSWMQPSKCELLRSLPGLYDNCTSAQKLRIKRQLGLCLTKSIEYRPIQCDTCEKNPNRPAPRVKKVHRVDDIRNGISNERLLDSLTKTLNVRQSAKELGMGRETVYLRIKRYPQVFKEVAELVRKKG